MSAIDQLGFVSLDEIQNVFTYELAEIEQDLLRQGVPANHRVIVEWIDGIKLKLMSRAKDNLQKYLTTNPEVKKEMRDERAAKEAAETRIAWDQRVARNRQRAMQTSGE